MTNAGHQVEERLVSPEGIDSATPAIPHHVLFIVLIAAIAVFQFATIRSGHLWGDDFAHYILHARALLEGAGYDDTGFIYHTSNSWYSPRVYPPGFPLLLVPVYALVGLNYVALKALVVAFFIGGIAVFAQLTRPLLPTSYWLSIIALLGFQPYLTDFKNNILPDLPFIFFVLTSLLLIRRFDMPRPTLAAHIGVGATAGAVAFFAMSVRTIGIAVFAAAILAELIRHRRPPAAFVAFIVTGLILFSVQRSLMPPDSGYGDQVADVAVSTGVAALLPGPDKALDLAAETVLLWQNPSKPLRNISGVVVLALSIVGYLLRLRKAPSILEAYVFTYCAALFLFPALHLRYILPVVPFIFFYAAAALAYAASRFGTPARLFGLAVGLSLAVASGAQLIHADYGVISDGATSESALQLYAAVRKCTAPDDRVVFARARVLALYTRRPSLVTPYGPVNMMDFLTRQRARFVVARHGDATHSAMRDAAGVSIPIFANEEFVVYEITDSAGRADAEVRGCSIAAAS